MNNVSYAGFWRRLAAQLIDGLVVVIPCMVAAVIGAFIGGYLLANLFSLVIIVVYYAKMLASSWQATVGKRVMNVYVVDATTGGRLSPLHAAGRYFVFAGFGSILALMPLSADGHSPQPIAGLLSAIHLAYILLLVLTVVFSREKTGIHDMICKTRVLEGRPHA